MIAEAIKQRLDARTEYDTVNGCWLWSGPTRGIYGSLTLDGKSRGAHRWAYQAYKGEIPEGHFVCHRCDVPLCINPDHLWTGTPKQNSEDRDAKGRQPAGEGSPTSKLTDEMVTEILSSGESSYALARRMPVTSSVIRKVRRGQWWRHLSQDVSAFPRLAKGWDNV